MKLFIVAAVLAFAVGANAECANMCSGHGVCGQWDRCTCYRNWFSSDCSRRVCPFGSSFVDGANGDLNHDGSVSSSSYKVEWANSDQWEDLFDFAADEGHMYMECSNKGLCDRKAGECKCFDGFTGSACQWQVCPNDCSGKGVCRSLEDVGRSQLTSNARGDGLRVPVAASTWESHKNRRCVCDPGYSGIDCSSRDCPKGDDPLTTDEEDAAATAEGDQQYWPQVDGQPSETAQVDEKQRLTWDCNDGSGAVTALTGTMALRYRDDHKDVWDTRRFDPETGADIAAALVSIPNGIIECVTVTTTAWATGVGVYQDIEFACNPGDLNILTVVPGENKLVCSGTYTTTFAISENQKGTKENTECAGRGLCDGGTGLCKCFKGYHGDACEHQSSLAF